MKTFRVEWSSIYEAKNEYDALVQALGEIETAIKYHEGATGFIVSDYWVDNDPILIDIEYQGGCDECGKLYNKADNKDHCVVEGMCLDHCTCIKE